LSFNPGAPERPPPPIVGKVTHHNIELSLNDACDNNLCGDERVRVAVQEEDKQGEWGTVYVYVYKCRFITYEMILL